MTPEARRLVEMLESMIKEPPIVRGQATLPPLPDEGIVYMTPSDAIQRLLSGEVVLVKRSRLIEIAKELRRP